MHEDFLLMTVSLNDKEEPTLQNIAKHFGVPLDSFDKDFGVVNVDTENNIYTFRISAAEWNKLNKTDKNISGPFSNPKIEPFDLKE